MIDMTDCVSDHAMPFINVLIILLQLRNRKLIKKCLFRSIYGRASECIENTHMPAVHCQPWLMF